MTPLIPALINLLVSGIRKKGGGGGGGFGGKPQMSDAEKDDRYWHEKNMSSDIGDFSRTMDSINKGWSGIGGGKVDPFTRAYGEHMNVINPKR